jgi:hypothetical protein
MAYTLRSTEAAIAIWYMICEISMACWKTFRSMRGGTRISSPGWMRVSSSAIKHLGAGAQHDDRARLGAVAEATRHAHVVAHTQPRAEHERL